MALAVRSTHCICEDRLKAEGAIYPPSCGLYQEPIYPEHLLCRRHCRLGGIRMKSTHLLGLLGVISITAICMPGSAAPCIQVGINCTNCTPPNPGSCTYTATYYGSYNTSCCDYTYNPPNTIIKERVDMYRCVVAGSNCTSSPAWAMCWTGTVTDTQGPCS